MSIKRIKAKLRGEWYSTGLLAVCLALILVFFLLLVYPVSRIILRFNINDLRLLFERTDFVQVLFQSIFLSLCVSIIAIIIALVVSLFIREQNHVMQKVFIVCFTMPILIPTISIGMGIMYLFSRNGLIYQWLGLRINIYGFNGLLIGMVLNITPLAILQIYDVLRYEETHLHIEAKALCLSPLSRLYILTLPRVKTVLKRAFFATFLFSFSDFGINLMVGGRYRTLSLTLYQEIIGRMNFGRAAVISVFMWVPLLILFVVCMRKSAFSFKHNEQGTTTALFFGIRGQVISCALLIIIAAMFLLPIIAFMLSSLRPTDITNPDIWQNYRALIHLNLLRYLRNSLVIAICVSVFGTVLSCMTAYVASKARSPLARVINIVALIPFSVPGLVIGLGFVIGYIAVPGLYSTFIPIICAVTINFFGVPYFLFLNNFALMGDEIEISAKIFRIGWWDTLLRIYLPQMKQTILEAMMFYFVNSMITISAIVVMFRARTMPLSILITQFEGQLMIFRAAAVTTIIVAINIVAKVIFYACTAYVRSRLSPRGTRRAI
ncbi:MAG: ABC transporter permease subunit [Defluviitaleaceae bacterium]|nr:ABC transporter permease subunit [Defluviitaleaceae bacterium]